MRKALDDLEKDRRSMIAALHSNGNLGGEDLEKAITALNDQFNETRDKVILGKAYEDSEAEQFVDEKWWK